MCADRVVCVGSALRRKVIATLVSVSLGAVVAVPAALVATPAMAHDEGLSEASALSALPVAISVSAPLALVAGASVVSIVAIDVVSDGTVWVLQRASDGARFSVKWAGMSVGMASVAVGTAITVTAVSAGWVLSTAGEVLALIPNTLGKALLHHERVLK
ncbi:MAG: hypothetical protein QM749_12880 [Aquabacterium sp.]